MFKLELTFNSLSDLAAFVQKQEGDTPAPKATKPAAATKTPAPKAEKAEAPVEDLAETTDEVSEEEEAAPTYEQVKDAILEINRLKGKDAAVAVLKKFGAEKVGPQLKEKDYPAIMAECKRIKG